VAGPWFTVLQSGNDWQQLESIWISNGRDQEKVTVEIRVQLEDARDDD